MKPFRLSRLVVPLLCLAPLAFAETYTFTLDGKPTDPHIVPVLGERLGVPSPGDVGEVAGFPFVLQRPAHYRFQHPAGTNKLYAQIDDGPLHCVSIRVPDGESESPDPLSSLSSAERGNLWGVLLEIRPSAWPEALQDIDWSNAVFAWRGELPDDIEFPPELRYLSSHSDDSSNGDRPARIPPLPELRFLNVELRDADHLSALPISKAPHLRNLNITGGTVTDLQSLEANRELRFLKLRSLDGLDSIAFAAKLPNLRVLKIDETAVSNLRPLAGLQHLRLLSANATKVENIPALDSLPALRDLRLHSTPLAKKGNVIRPLRSQVNVLVKDWEPAIKAFEESDEKSPPPKNAALFIGSSSARMWDLDKFFPDMPTINRGFGGSELSDSLRYFDRIVLPYRPRAILLYAGDNDIANGETAEQVVADYKAFAAKVRKHLPDTHFAFLPIKPSLARWDLWPEMHKANEAIRKLTEADDHLHYLDTATPMLGDDGKPLPHLFADDGLHLNEAGYTLWSALVRRWLKRGAGF